MKNYSKEVSEIALSKEEQAHKESKETKMEGNSQVGICVIQGNKVKYINRRLAEIFGYSYEEMKSLQSTRFLCERIEPKKDHYRYMSFRKTGDTIFLDLYSIEISYKGHPAELISLIDITEQKLRNQNLKETKDVNCFCPVCGKNGILKIPSKVVKEAKNLITVSIPKNKICEHHFQAFIDKNFTLRGYQKVDIDLH